MTGILLAPAIWNRFPLLEWDTGGYLARWFEGYLVPSRPAAYGLLLAAAARLEFWPVLLLQAVLTLWILALVLREFAPGRRPFLLLALVTVLSFATTLPWLTSILLTDIFAGLAVLALHLVVFGRELGSRDRLALIGFIGVAAATHSATLGVLAVLASLACLTALLPGCIVSPARARQAAAALVLGLTMTLSANAVVSGRFAFTPGGFGIMFGRMLQDGIVTRYLDDHCPDSRLKLCPFRRELPLNADAFLWGESVFNRLGRFAGLGEEMQTIVLGSLRDYPLLQIRTALVATATQFGQVGTGEGVVNQIWHTYGIMARYTPAVVSALWAARQQRGELGFEALNRVHVPVALLSAVLLPILLAAGARRPELRELTLLAATVSIALLVNAFVCGALSNPHDRYGARLIWLAPLTIMLVPIALRAHQTATAAVRRRSHMPPLRAVAKVHDAAGVSS